jgi:hypothetical protein
MAVTLNASTASGLIATSDTSGNIELQSNGTTKATVSSSGLAIGQYNPSASLITSGTAQNSTSGTSIDFTGIPSWVKRITVMFNGVSTNGTSNPLIQLGDSGGIENTGYVAASTIMTTGVSTSTYTTGFGLATALSTNAVSGAVVFTLISTNVWIASGVMASSTNSVSGTMTGTKSLSATLDRVRITTVNGTDTFDAGSINILYE